MFILALLHYLSHRIKLISRQGAENILKGVIPLPHHHPWLVLQRLGQMRRLDRFTPRQVRDRARQLEHAMIGARWMLQCHTAVQVGVK